MKQVRCVLCRAVMPLLIWGLVVVPVLGGAHPDRDADNWDKVKQLPAGREILVVQNDAKSFQGRLQRVSDENVVMRLATGEQSLAKGSIERVSTRGASHRWRNLALGAGIGLGAGAGIGAAAGNPNSIVNGRGIGAAVGGVIGLAAGAAVGAALPTGGWHEVYRAR